MPPGLQSGGCLAAAGGALDDQQPGEVVADDGVLLPLDRPDDGLHLGGRAAAESFLQQLVADGHPCVEHGLDDAVANGELPLQRHFAFDEPPRGVVGSGPGSVIVIKAGYRRSPIVDEEALPVFGEEGGGADIDRIGAAAGFIFLKIDAAEIGRRQQAAHFRQTFPQMAVAALALGEDFRLLLHAYRRLQPIVAGRQVDGHIIPEVGADIDDLRFEIRYERLVASDPRPAAPRARHRRGPAPASIPRGLPWGTSFPWFVFTGCQPAEKKIDGRGEGVYNTIEINVI